MPNAWKTFHTIAYFYSIALFNVLISWIKTILTLVLTERTDTMPYSFSVQVLLLIAQRLKRFFQSLKTSIIILVACIKQENPKDTGVAWLFQCSTLKCCTYTDYFLHYLLLKFYLYNTCRYLRLKCFDKIPCYGRFQSLSTDYSTK